MRGKEGRKQFFGVPVQFISLDDLLTNSVLWVGDSDLTDLSGIEHSKARKIGCNKPSSDFWLAHSRLPGRSCAQSGQAPLDTPELRAADSLQLAAALTRCRQRRAKRFVCADQTTLQGRNSGWFLRPEFSRAARLDLVWNLY